MLFDGFHDCLTNQLQRQNYQQQTSNRDGAQKKKHTSDFDQNLVKFLDHYRKLARKNLSSLGGERGELEVPKGYLILKKTCFFVFFS